MSLLNNAIFLLLCACLLLIPTVTAAKSRSRHSHASVRRHLDDEGGIHCIIHEIGSLTKITTLSNKQLPRQTPPPLTCSADNFGPTLLLKGNYDTFFIGNVTSGATSMIIPVKLISPDLIVDLDNPSATQIITSTPSIEGSQENNMSHTGDRRTLALVRGSNATSNILSFQNKRKGFHKVLVVRVTDKEGHTPTYSAREIANHVFHNKVSMASGFRACSHYKLFLDKADGGSDIKNGVVDVKVDQDLSVSHQSTACVNAADAALSTSSYDVGNTHTYTMYICPEMSGFDHAVGVAQMGGTKSWYNDVSGSLPFVQMHEIGHNLMLFHSSEGNLEYGDPTGFMGDAYDEQRMTWGKICLNAAKTYQTGWYSNYHQDVDPTSTDYIGSLVDVNSAYNGRIQEHDHVTVRISSLREKETLYFMLHRLEGITSDMVEKFIPTFANRVNIVSQELEQGVPSKALSQLASGEEYIQENWAGTGKALHIKVCSIAERSYEGGAKVIVYLQGSRTVSCSMDPKPQTSSPSPSPTVQKGPACVDSPLKMIFPNKIARGCDWVAETKTRDRCEIEGVASHCPLTCGTCVECVDSGKRFEMPFGEIKSCAWVRRTNTKSRCKRKILSKTCRSTCGTCS